jgi:hypothetical protein
LTLTKHIKIVVLYDPPISIDAFHPTGFQCVDTDCSLGPLSFESTVVFFGKVCPHAMSDPHWSNSAIEKKKSGNTWKVLGEGIPAKAILVAKAMTGVE